MYAKIVNNSVVKFPYTTYDLKQDNPGVSFPAELSDALLAGYNMYPVTEGAIPERDTLTQQLQSVVQQVNGVWTRVWSIANYDESTAEMHILNKRNKLLTDTDWTQLSDTSLDDSTKAAWATYRQALRDITDQDGYPLSVTWPTQP